MTTTKDILGLTVGLGSLSLVAKSGKIVKDSMKEYKPKKMIKDFVGLSTGIALIKPISEQVNKL